MARGGRTHAAALVALACAKSAHASGPSACTTWFETQQHGWNFRNVTTFGAVGDGIHDDTAALQAAIDYQRGGDAGSNADKVRRIV